ncbi:hypothetical protein BC826DRAFT_114649 [Russula brevipes]|nr:hypothetical protein BC826DRAFT_114649 [Russula brevipes]
MISCRRAVYLSRTSSTLTCSSSTLLRFSPSPSLWPPVGAFFVLDSSLFPSRRIAHCTGFPWAGVTTLPSLIGLTVESLTPFNVGSTFWLYLAVANIESSQSCGERREYNIDKFVVREPLNQELHVMRSNRPLLHSSSNQRQFPLLPPSSAPQPPNPGPIFDSTTCSACPSRRAILQASQPASVPNIEYDEAVLEANRMLTEIVEYRECLEDSRERRKQEQYRQRRARARRNPRQTS